METSKASNPDRFEGVKALALLLGVIAALVGIGVLVAAVIMNAPKQLDFLGWPLVAAVIVVFVVARFGLRKQ